MREDLRSSRIFFSAPPGTPLPKGAFIPPRGSLSREGKTE